MRATFENALHVTPEVFFERLFFDADYNAGLYEKLGFQSYEVTELTELPDGNIRRSLRAEPPIHAPGLVQRRLSGKVYYTESGVFDRREQAWTFETVPSVASSQAQIRGRITLRPHAEGCIHVCELEVNVRAFGLGSMIERSIEQNTRDSYRINTDYTNAFARERGLLAPGAPR